MLQGHCHDLHSVRFQVGSDISAYFTALSKLVHKPNLTDHKRTHAKEMYWCIRKMDRENALTNCQLEIIQRIGTVSLIGKYFQWYFVFQWHSGLKTCGATRNPEYPRTRPDRTETTPGSGHVFKNIFGSGRVGDKDFGPVRAGIFFTGYHI